MTPFESLTITSTLLNHFGSDCHNPDNYIHSYRGQITDYLEDDGKDMGEIFYSLVYFEGALFGGLTLGDLLGPVCTSASIIPFVIGPNNFGRASYAIKR